MITSGSVKSGEERVCVRNNSTFSSFLVVRRASTKNIRMKKLSSERTMN